MNSLPWSPDDLSAVVALLSATLAYVLYHYAADAKALRRALGAGQPASVFAQKLAGGAILGVIPLVAVFWSQGDVTLSSLAAVGLGVPAGESVGLVLGAFAILLPVLVLASRGAAHRERYPQARPERWTRKAWATNAACWAAYLFGYELMFRGVLLFTLSAAYGPWLAIAVTTGLYVFAHLPKDAGETAGCVVMGVGFGALALTTGAMWAPFVLHLLVAVASDSLAISRSGARLRPACESAAGAESSQGGTRVRELV